MTNHVAKVIEIVGTSETGVDDAISSAIARASETVRHMRWFQVTEMRGQIEDGKVGRYQVMMKIGFALDEDAVTN